VLDEVPGGEHPPPAVAAGQHARLYTGRDLLVAGPSFRLSSNPSSFYYFLPLVLPSWANFSFRTNPSFPHS
jgi:hypothetical protein